MSGLLTAMIPLRPLTREARDGRYQFLSDGRLFALARWDGQGFAYPGGAALDFAPTHFAPAHRAVSAGGDANA